MTLSKSFRQFLRAEGGIAAIEMCFIFPLMLLIYFGLLDLTGLITHSRKITTVANSVADMVSQNRNAVLKSNIQDYFKVADLVMKPNPASRVKIIVRLYRMVGNTPTQIWTVENASDMTCSEVPATTGMAPLMANGSDLIVTQACTTFRPYIAVLFGHVLLGSVEPEVDQMITMSPRSSKTLTCFTNPALTVNC